MNEYEIDSITLGHRFPQRVCSSWVGGILRRRARTSCHAESGCVRIAFANPVSAFCAGPHSAPVTGSRFTTRGAVIKSLSAMTRTAHVYEVRPRKDKRGVDLISDALPFGRLWYDEPNAVSNAVDYAKFRRMQSCDPGLR